MPEPQMLFWIKVAAFIVAAIGFWRSWRNLTRIRARRPIRQAGSIRLSAAYALLQLNPIELPELLLRRSRAALCQ
jgi:hypothetical protein